MDAVTLVPGVLRDGARRAPEGLVVGHVRQRGAAARHAVADRRRGVVQVLRLDQHVAHAEEPLVELREVDAAPQLAELHREVRVLHLPGHRLLEAPLEAERRVDVQLGAREERGHEEGEALDVVPVRVADEEVEPDGMGQRPGEVQAELTRARAAVEDDHGAVGGPDLDAGRVAAVHGRLRTGRGDGPTCSPEAYMHGGHFYHIRKGPRTPAPSGRRPERIRMRASLSPTGGQR